ncbi:MAG: divergent polysaccharide deacetylase family protein [Candidatus Omnitrophica bacterium]|nr:divergent polysaccharide deacetylase family protein [Candidatus Omnitrophota bacterium]
MRRSRHRKAHRSRSKRKNNKDKFIPLLSLIIIALVLFILYSLPRDKEKTKPTVVPLQNYSLVRTESVVPHPTLSFDATESRETQSELNSNPEVLQKKESVTIDTKTDLEILPKKQTTTINTKANSEVLEKKLATPVNTKANSEVLQKKETSTLSTKVNSVVLEKKLATPVNTKANSVVLPKKETTTINTKTELEKKDASVTLVLSKKTETSVFPSKEKLTTPAQAPTKKNNSVVLKQKSPTEKTQTKIAKNSVTKNTQLVKLPVEMLPKFFPKPLIKGKIAIVLDDWGQNLNNFNLIKNIRQPLTLAILPNLVYSRRIALEAKIRNFEIILHLPMEPYPRPGLILEKDTITTEMDDLTIKDILLKQLKRLPYIRGVNNHMGSKATADYRVMRIIFEELKKKNLYFLDSYVSANSICFKLTRGIKIRFARRDVFLDNEDNPDYIRAQLEKLKQLAQSRGYAIGIGHDRKITLEVLKEELPKLQKQGFKFVTVSELIK